MERGIYFDAWFKHNYCYHPSLPLRSAERKAGVQRYDREGKTWIHVLNYQYDEERDRVILFEKLKLTLRDVPGTEPEILVPDGCPVPSVELRQNGPITEMTLRNAGLYTVIAFEKNKE